MAEAGVSTAGPEIAKAAKHGLSAKRIRRIAKSTGARSYLEIGVSRGGTFLRVDLPRKVAVDPEFRFDVEAHRRPGIDFHQVPSDRYFTEFAGGEKFDIVFIDGLHVFPQVFRDFVNSLLCAHDRTVWLIDDVEPDDEFSAMPDRKRALKRRTIRTGSRSQRWQGDVYKLVFAIHDFFPMLSYVSPNGGGGTQTIVWRAPRPNVAPVLGSLAAIDRLRYRGFVELRAVLNLMDDDDAYRLFRRAMRRR